MRRPHRDLGLASVLGMVTGVWLVLTAGVQALSLTWNTTTGTWDVGSTANWLPGPTTFANGDSVTFGTPAADSTVTVAGSGVSPSLMTVSNSTRRYTFTGGTITSTGGIAITGTGFTQFNAGAVMGPNGSVRIGPGSQVTMNFANFGGSAAAGDLARISTLSQGAVILSQDSTAALDLTGYSPTFAVGSDKLFSGYDYAYARLTGALTPAGNTFTFTGGGGGLLLDTVLADSSVARGLTVQPFGLSASTAGRKPLVILTQANTLTGPVSVAGADLRLAGTTGSATGVGEFNIGYNGILCLDPGMRRYGWGDEPTVSVNNLDDRVGNSATVRLNGGSLYFFGDPNTGTAETIGTLAVAAGTDVVDARYTNHSLPIVGTDPLVTRSTLTGTKSSELVFGQLTRTADNGHLIVRGESLGGSAAVTGVSRIKFTTAPTLVGGGGAAGSTNVSIVPFMYYNGTSSTGNSFVTHDANGLRALTSGEYFAGLAGAASTDNVKVTATSTTVSVPTTINSLQIQQGVAGQTISGAGPLTITSGALMIQGPRATDGWDLNMTVPMDFAGREANLFVMGEAWGGRIRFNGKITHTDGNGLTISHLVASYVPPMWIGSTLNDYTGPTTINRGTVYTSASEVIPDSSDLRVRAGASFTVGSSFTETVASLAGAGTIGFENASAKLVVGSGTAASNTVVVGGAVTPGDSAGTLTIGGNLAANTNAVFNFELGAPGFVGMGVNDLIAVNGNLTLDGTLNIAALPGFGPAFGQGTGSYTLFTYSGTLTNNILNIGVAPPDYGYVIGAGGGVVTLTVPEPVSGLLFGLAALGLWHRRERR